MLCWKATEEEKGDVERCAVYGDSETCVWRGESGGCGQRFAVDGQPIAASG